MKVRVLKAIKDIPNATKGDVINIGNDAAKKLIKSKHVESCDEISNSEKNLVKAETDSSGEEDNINK